MNIIRLQEVLGHRGIVPYTGLRNKITVWSFTGPECISCNRLSSSTVGHTMHKSLKLKLQHVLNINHSAEAECPAVFVGGRRRNRKKRKNKNGQNKRRGKKCGVAEPVPTPPKTSTPFDDALTPYYSLERPIVSCLDIKEPVFTYNSVTSQDHVTKKGSDSMYNSNDSLGNYSSRRDSGCEHGDSGEEVPSDSDSPDEASVIKIGFPRTNSKDSGVFDDDSADDAGYDDEIDDDVIVDVKPEDEDTDIDIQRQSVQVEETASEEPAAPSAEPSKVSDEPTEYHPDKFDEIDLNGKDIQEKSDPEEEPLDVAAAPVDDDLAEIGIVRQLSSISDADDLLKLVSDDTEEEDDIIFDLSQLELNNTPDDISSLTQANIKFQLDESSPTGLEEGSLIRVPMDLLIDDNDKDDEVLFDATNRNRKQVSITCNPLYEHALKEEDDKLSIKSFQSGFTTHFDNINYIQIPGTASNKAVQKETSPLLSRRPGGGEKEDELACCVIL